MIRDIFWTPFDNRFSKLLDRLRDHQELFDREMTQDNQKAVELKLDRTLDGILKMERDAATKQSLRKTDIVEAFKNQKEENERLESVITAYFSKLEEGTRSIQEQRESESDRIAAEEMKTLNTRADEIRSWIHAPNYLMSFENARRTRLGRTGKLFVKADVYLSWEGALAPKGSTSASRLDVAGGLGQDVASMESLPKHLVIRAKPGFGKSVLSSLVIEDLQSRPLSITRNSTNSRNVAFFHFSSSNSEAARGSKALRALLAQLFHKQRQERHLVDAMSLMIDSSSTGQVYASDDEIEEALRLCLSLFPNTFLVIDGIDECDSPLIFMSQLYKICDRSETKSIVLGRPSIGTPAKFKTEQIELRLQPDRNLEDIQTYLKDELEGLLDWIKMSGGLSV